MRSNGQLPARFIRGLVRWRGTAGILVLIAGATRATSQSAPVAAAHGESPQAATASFPFEYDDARVFVPVRVAGDTTRWFVLDTGVGGTIVDVGLAARLGLAATDAGTVTGAGAGQMRDGRAAGVAISVGGVALAPSSISVSPIDSVLFPFAGRHTPGIIGSQFFDEHVVELDFDAHQIRVYDPTTYQYRGSGVTIPITFVGTSPVVTGTLTLPDSARRVARLLVDLGAKATLLVTEPFIRRTALHSAFPRSVRVTLGAGVGGETRYDFVRVPRLTLGARNQAEISGLVAGLSVEGTLRSDDYDALLGADFLSRYRVIFDYARKRLILEPRTPVAAPAEADMSGLYLLMPRDSNRVVVHHVIADSPADRVGIRVGDIVETVNGERIAGGSLWPWRAALRSGDGHAVTVEIDRAGTRIVKTIVLRRLV